MEPTTPAHGRGYYATRTTVRYALAAIPVTLIFAAAGMVERLAEGLGL